MNNLKKLETKNHTLGRKKETYKDTQIIRHAMKANVTQPIEAYRVIADGIICFLPGFNLTKKKMICLGTRNNHERDCFASFFQNFEVKSLDISSKSNADYVMDFTSLPAEWESYWDIVYSNSIDHSYSATATFDEWLKVIKPAGILALGFSYEHETSETDICAFEESNVESFLRSKDSIKLIGNIPGYSKNASTWIVQKL